MRLRGLVAACLCLAVGCASRAAPSGASAAPAGPAREPPGAGLDEEGVLMLYPSAPGCGFALGSGDPNATARFTIEKSVRAARRIEGGFAYWTVGSYRLEYASGGSGLTSRLHMYASGAAQERTWGTQDGWLSDASAPRDQELTVFLRARGRAVPERSAVALKIRGGAHAAKNPALSSCAMMELRPADRGHPARFGKELEHPLYDYIELKSLFDASLVEGEWVGLKLVSFSDPDDPKRVVNRLYLDRDPIAPDGSVRNDWRLFCEYVDVEGLRTGRYEKLVDWSGWETTVRVDGYREVDFALPSLRPIEVAVHRGRGR